MVFSRQFTTAVKIWSPGAAMRVRGADQRNSVIVPYSRSDARSNTSALPLLISQAICH